MVLMDTQRVLTSDNGLVHKHTHTHTHTHNPTGTKQLKFCFIANSVEGMSLESGHLHTTGQNKTTLHETVSDTGDLNERKYLQDSWCSE